MSSPHAVARRHRQGRFPPDAGTHGAHATQNVEYGGSGLAGLSINARKTLTTMSRSSPRVRDVRARWRDAGLVRARNTAPFEPVYPDADATYLAVRRWISAVSSRWSRCRTRGEQLAAVKATAGTRIDQAYIGSCANGTLDDLEIAARVVKGRRVASGTRFIVVPASQTVYRDAMRSGAIQTLADAGAMIAPPTCGACGGGHMGVLGAGGGLHYLQYSQLQGPHGDPSSKVYMGSPVPSPLRPSRRYLDPREFLN